MSNNNRNRDMPYTRNNPGRFTNGNSRFASGTRIPRAATHVANARATRLPNTTRHMYRAIPPKENPLQRVNIPRRGFLAKIYVFINGRKTAVIVFIDDNITTITCARYNSNGIYSVENGEWIQYGYMKNGNTYYPDYQKLSELHSDHNITNLPPDLTERTIDRVCTIDSIGTRNFDDGYFCQEKTINLELPEDGGILECKINITTVCVVIKATAPVIGKVEDMRYRQYTGLVESVPAKSVALTSTSIIIPTCNPDKEERSTLSFHKCLIANANTTHNILLPRNDPGDDLPVVRILANHFKRFYPNEPAPVTREEVIEAWMVTYNSVLPSYIYRYNRDLVDRLITDRNHYINRNISSSDARDPRDYYYRFSGVLHEQDRGSVDNQRVFLDMMNLFIRERQVTR